MYNLILHTGDGREHLITFAKKSIIKQYPDELHVEVSFTDIINLTLFLKRTQRNVLDDN